MKLIAALLCFFFISSCSTFGDSRKEKAELHLKIATSHIEKKNWPLALTNLLKAEEYAPRNPAVHNALGLTYYFREKYDLSETHFKRALELDTKNTETQNNYIKLLLTQKRYVEAEKEANIAISDLTYPEPNRSYFNLGLIYFEQKLFEKASNAFAKSLTFQNEDCSAQNLYGRSLFELKHYGQASAALDRAIGFCQKYLVDEPHYFSALTYYRMGEPEKSRARFQEILRLYPEGQYRSKAQSMLNLMQKVHE